MKIKPLLGLLLPVILLWACDSEKNGCQIPPKGFSESDLVGTWVATRLPSTDTLIIRGDGTYKQLIHLENPTVDYESGWLRWQLEYADKGVPYLHMQDMRLCAYVPDIINCKQSGGGKFYWYDFCRGEAIPMLNEGTLIVLGISSAHDQPPRGIQLTLPLAWPESVWAYKLVEP
jgi:hypothetical protein